MPVLNADPRRTNPRLSALLSAFISVSKYGAVKLFESTGRAGGLPMKLEFLGKRNELFEACHGLSGPYRFAGKLDAFAQARGFSAYNQSGGGI